MPPEKSGGAAPRRAGARRPSPRPFLKWAGGKSNLLSELTARLPQVFSSYHEPFLGGGALFFEMARRGEEHRAGLADANRSLVETYIAVKRHPTDLIAALGRHRNDETHYYRVREQEPGRLDLIERAARMIYLNRTCYNGLYRENQAGRFNVPFGRYKNPCICDADNLLAVSRVLRRARLRHRPFTMVLERAVPGDLVYFDPPYHPLSHTASFTAYSRGGFDESDQRQLADVFSALAGRGVHVMLSNSDTPLTRDLYASWNVETVWAPRPINSRADRRGKVTELLVRSYD